jgi:hypothetical protein
MLLHRSHVACSAVAAGAWLLGAGLDVYEEALDVDCWLEVL